MLTWKSSRMVPPKYHGPQFFQSNRWFTRDILKYDRTANRAEMGANRDGLVERACAAASRLQLEVLDGPVSHLRAVVRWIEGSMFGDPFTGET